MKQANFSIPDNKTEREFFSFLCGFKTEKIKVGKLTHWTVQLIEDANIVEVKCFRQRPGKPIRK